MNKIMVLLAAVCLLGVFELQGCTTSSSVTKTETVTTSGVETQGNQGNFERGESSPKTEEPGITKVEKRREVKEKRTESESRGILGTTLHFIGQVLAFPFKVAAGVIEFIF